MGHFNPRRKHTGTLLGHTWSGRHRGHCLRWYILCAAQRHILASCRGAWHWHPGHSTHQATRPIYVSSFNPNHPGRATRSSFHCASHGALSPNLSTWHCGPLLYIVHRIFLVTSEGFLSGHWKQPRGSRWFQQLSHTKIAKRTGRTQRKLLGRSSCGIHWSGSREWACHLCFFRVPLVAYNPVA